MNDIDPIDSDEISEEKMHIPVSDKRRFDEHGQPRHGVAAEAAAEPAKAAKSPREIELEGKLKAEIDRREAAEAKLVGVQAKFDEAKASMEKETAEMRSRMMKTLDDRAKQSQFNFLTSLLPVLDNLNLAIDASEKDPSLEHLREGVKGTARSFESALLSVGVEAIPSIGSTFDPEMHEAIDMVEADAEMDGKVTAEYSKGYRFGEKLLRPAKVQVGKSVTQDADEYSK